MNKYMAADSKQLGIYWWFTRESSIYALRVIVEWLVIHTIAPTGHTGSSSRSSARNKFSQQSPEWFDWIGMANLTANCGTVLLIELTMNCSNSKISVSAVERSDFVKLSFSLGGPRCRTLKVRVGQAPFFCCSARCLHQSYSVSKSTSSKIGSYFLYRRLTLSHEFSHRLHPCHHTRTDSMHSSLALHPQKLAQFWERSKKHQLHRRVISRKHHSCVVTCFPWGVFCARRHLPTSRNTARPNFATAARTPRRGPWTKKTKTKFSFSFF